LGLNQGPISSERVVKSCTKRGGEGRKLESLKEKTNMRRDLEKKIFWGSGGNKTSEGRIPFRLEKRGVTVPVNREAVSERGVGGGHDYRKASDG